MKREFTSAVGIVGLTLAIPLTLPLLNLGRAGAVDEGRGGGPLPPPALRGSVSVEEAIARRRSVRVFAPEPIERNALGQLLWAAQGITSPDRRLRAAPSAGALYPLEIYALTHEGVFHYVPSGHRLERIAQDDRRPLLAEAALGQDWVLRAPASLVFTAVVARTARKYGARAERYATLETGLAAENTMLEAISLGLQSVPVGAFDDDEVRRILGLPQGQLPLLIVCVGRPVRPAPQEAPGTLKVPKPRGEAGASAEPGRSGEPPAPQ